MGALVLSLKAFSDRLLKTAPKDYVFVRVLKDLHKNEKHTEAEWQALLNAARSIPA